MLFALLLADFCFCNANRPRPRRAAATPSRWSSGNEAIKLTAPAPAAVARPLPSQRNQRLSRLQLRGSRAEVV